MRPLSQAAMRAILGIQGRPQGLAYHGICGLAQDQKENIMTAKEKAQVKELLELASDLSFAQTKLNKSWPDWEKRLFWTNLMPQIDAYKTQVKELIGFYVMV